MFSHALHCCIDRTVHQLELTVQTVHHCVGHLLRRLVKRLEAAGGILGVGLGRVGAVDRAVNGDYRLQIAYELLLQRNTGEALTVPVLQALKVHRQRGMLALLG